MHLLKSGFAGNLNVTQGDCLRQSSKGIARGNKLLAYVSLVSDFDQRFHDRLVSDLLLIIQFGSARIAGSVNMANVILVLMNSANHITIHDLDMVDIKQQLQIG